MTKAFRVTPKKVKKTNGTVLTPEMVVVVNSKYSNPFNNGAEDVKEAYMRVYGFDYKKACCSQGDFNLECLG